MKTIGTRLMISADDRYLIYKMRYDYFVGARELDVAFADHSQKCLCDASDQSALQFGTFVGDELVGCFRVEFGPPGSMSFGADWAFGDFLATMPAAVALVTGLCTAPHLRDGTVITHMVRESVTVAYDLAATHSFFEVCPHLWPLYHAAGLTRKGGALPHRRTGLLTAVFHLDRSDRGGVRRFGADWQGEAAAIDDRDIVQDCEIVPERRRPAPRLALVVGGR